MTPISHELATLRHPLQSNALQAEPLRLTLLLVIAVVKSDRNLDLTDIRVYSLYLY